MELIFKHFWIIFIGFAIFNAIRRRKRVEPFILIDPALKEGYNKFILWHSILATIPFLVIGLALVTGELKDIFEIFDIHSSKWIIQSIYAYCLSIWVFVFWWIYFKDGAEFIERHRGV